MSDALTNASAAATVRAWLRNRAELPPQRSQRRFLVEQLGQQCAAEAVARGQGEVHLELLLLDAEEILESAWYATAPSVATKWWRDGDVPSEQEKKIIERSKKTLWDRHDPKISYIEGFESTQYFTCYKENLTLVIAKYMSKPWLRHPVLDFIFLDMLVTNEVCAFGEAIKERALTSSTPPAVGVFDVRYYKTKGKLSEVLENERNGSFKRWNDWFWSAFGFPVGAIWAAFHFNYVTLGWWILGLWAALWCIIIVIFILRGLSRFFRRVPEPLTPYQSQLKLWTSMCGVWRLLDGPVVNPTRVREAMRSTAEAGAVWDNSAWAIVDSVIQRDPSVWVVSPQH